MSESEAASSPGAEEVRKGALGRRDWGEQREVTWQVLRPVKTTSSR